MECSKQLWKRWHLPLIKGFYPEKVSLNLFVCSSSFHSLSIRFALFLCRIHANDWQFLCSTRVYVTCNPLLDFPGFSNIFCCNSHVFSFKLAFRENWFEMFWNLLWIIYLHLFTLFHHTLSLIVIFSKLPAFFRFLVNGQKLCISKIFCKTGFPCQVKLLFSSCFLSMWDSWTSWNVGWMCL